jgi:myo-inositol-1(or 4)-monophosphatase
MSAPTLTPSSSLDLAQARAFAQALAREAAQMLHDGQASQATIEKAPGDWCSALDSAIEAHLRQRIAQHYSDHRFWGEESSAADMTPEAGRFTWLVDPIDGSMNFLRGYPQYAIAIALLDGSEPVVGCIMDPVRDEVFSASLGHGADCNGRALKVADTAHLAQAVAATVFPKPKALFMDTYVAELDRVLRNTAGVRRAGSMALEMAYLAAGRIDVFWERGMGAWDAAAGRLLIHEAGGEVWSLDDRPWWQSQALASATPALRNAWHALF